MKVLLINGSPHEKGCTYTALTEVAKTLEENQIETEIFHIGKTPIRGCMGCGHCRKSQSLIKCRAGSAAPTANYRTSWFINKTSRACIK